MGAFTLFNPNRYRLYPMDAAAGFNVPATTPPFLPPELAAQQAEAGTPPPPQFSVDDVVDLGTPAPSRKRQILSGLMRHVQAGIDAAATPNIAAGGGTDVMRGISNALDRQHQRDLTDSEMARRNRIEQAQAAQDMAQADWYRRRADAAMTGVWLNDGNGMQHNTVTGEQRPVGGVSQADARAKAEQERLAARKQALIAAGIDPNSREGYAALYGSAGAVMPKTGSTVGAQGQRMFYTMGADGIPTFTKEVAAPPKMSTVRGPSGETVFVEQRPGEGGTVLNSTPGVPPRQAAPAKTGRAAAPTAVHTQAVTQFVDRLLSDGQKNGYSLDWIIKAAENPQYYTDVPPSVKMDAVLRIKRAQAFGVKRAPAGGSFQGALSAVAPGAASTSSPATVRLQAPDGTIQDVPAAQADHYIKLGAKRI